MMMTMIELLHIRTHSLAPGMSEWQYRSENNAKKSTNVSSLRMKMLTIRPTRVRTEQTKKRSKKSPHAKQQF